MQITIYEDGMGRPQVTVKADLGTCGCVEEVAEVYRAVKKALEEKQEEV